ncbi:MAG: hypothetical protein DCC67_01340 [Planctomycetota bacterium]|nr:MAG: hypothetical protein DCC67_01340 [Planctomycetota bacterium]
MTRRSTRTWRRTLAATCALVATAAPCAAVTINFEPPAYAPGDVIGQDGWVKNAYYPTLNGTPTISAASPLAGTQSLSYTQTVAGGFSDISKNDVILITPGVQGTDVTVSYVIKGTSNSLGGPFGGVFLSAGAAGGSSPIFGRINGGVFEVGANLAIDAVNEFFFAEGERIKVTYEVDFDNASMNLILENLDFGDIYSQTTPFFAGYGAPSGPNGEYVVDVGLLLRGGNIQIDDITLTAGVGPLVTDFAWNAPGSGSWNIATNWDPPGLPGTVAGRQHVTLGPADSPTTIYNNSTRTLNSLDIDSAQPYFLAGAGSLGFQADTSGPATAPPSLDVASGAHQIQLPIELQDDTTISVAAGASLDLNNQIDLNGNTLDVSGTVRINHSAIGGGTLASSGSLAASGAVNLAGNLISSGELLVGVDADGADSFVVAGDAILTGTVNVAWSPAAAPVGALTILTAGGSLEASGLTLAPEDARSFALGTEGNSLTLTFLGAAVPEPTTIALLAASLLGLGLERRRRFPTSMVAVAALLASLAAAPQATAISLDFEPPTYAAGASIAGQDGWNANAYVLADPFFGGVVNGTVAVTDASPLAGLQSVLYNQTVDPPTAGGTGASDVGRADTITAREHGTPAIDLEASFLLTADTNSVGAGSVGFFLGEGGRSPILILITGANSASAAGDILVGHDFALPDVGNYAGGSVFEFTIGVDLDGQNYEAFARNVTAGTPQVKLDGPAADDRFPFFGGIFPDDGDGVSYTFDVSLMLRSGTGRFDNIQVTAIPEPAAMALALLAVVGGLGAARTRRRGPATRLAVAGLVLATAPAAMAVSYTFENPPYTPGALNGQQGWDTGAYIFADPFFGGEVNGTVEISAATPLAGAQSVRYTQTIDPAAAGATGGSDVSRRYAVFGVEDGTDAADITGSFLLRADSNSLANGQLGVFVGDGGRSPMFIQVTNASVSGGTGDIIVGHDFAVPTVGTYVAGNVYEFRFGIDLDNQNYEAFARNVTAGTPEFQLSGPGPNGRLPFFGGAFGDDGDGQTYTFDTSLMLRSGTGQIDNFTAVGEDFVQAVWSGGSGDWGANPSWIPNIVPNAVAGANAPLAIFGDRITAPQTVFTNATQTVNGLRFDNANKYVVGGGGAIALKANTIGGTVNPTINVESGAHELQAAVNVLDNATVAVAAGGQLDFNNSVALGGKTLATSGAVNLNVGVSGGGSINNSGTLGTAGATPIAANLTSTGALAIDLGPTNTDYFNITGSATLSGVLDVTLEPGYTPTGSYTVLTASGGLNAAGLVLHASDTSAFTLGVSGNNLVLTVGGSTDIPGDFDDDGTVDAADLAQWKGDFGVDAGSNADGDADSDGNDFLIWQRHFGQTAAAPAASAVPEPAAAALAAAGLLAASIFRRNSRGA